MIDAVALSKYAEILLDHLMMNFTWECFWIIHAGKKAYQYSYERVYSGYNPSLKNTSFKKALLLEIQVC